MTGGLPGSLALGWNPAQFPSRHFATVHTTRTTGNASPEEKGNANWRFSIKAATTSGVLTLLGDTAAQLRSRWVRRQALEKDSGVTATGRGDEALEESELRNHDWLRALRMASFGFLIYGPASQIWYNFLDHVLRERTLRNLSVKVTLNQLVLGPFMVVVVFAWNCLWQGKLDGLLDLYRNHAVPILVDGWKFWIPASVLNFGVVPLQARVAFMSSCSIFWNFYLSTAVSKQ